MVLKNKKTSGLGWIHFSDTTRRRVLKVIDLLGEKGTIDELGIGVVRNAFSNELFSGMSTIMTRARYFYTVPYLLIGYLRTSPNISVTKFMRDSEADIMEALTRTYSNPEKERIIGHTIAQKNLKIGKRVQELVRKPSEIYWGGMRTFGMFSKTHSFAQLCQAINQGKYLNKSKDNLGNDKESGDDESGHEKWLDLFEVPYIPSWNQEQLELSQAEAEDFKQKISETMPGSFLTTILANTEFTDEFLSLDSFKQLPHTAFFSSLRSHNAKVITTAIQFWDLLEGAHIRFNVLLQNKPNQTSPISFEEEWEDWLNNTVNTFDWESFDINFLWKIVGGRSRINSYTQHFIDNWIHSIQNNVSIDVLDKIVYLQETKNKGERSKLLPQHLENYDGWVGIKTLDYRLHNVKTIVRDIANPKTINSHA